MFNISFNSDQLIILWTVIGITALVVPLTWFISREKFYNFNTNRWKPGINLPCLGDMEGKVIDFKKFQLHVRLYTSIMITAMMLGLLPLAFVAETAKNYDMYVIVSVAWVSCLAIKLIIFTLWWFPRRGDKYLNGNR